jgi:hypothetical protein
MSKEVMKLALSTLEGWANYDDWVWPESALEQAKRNTIEAITALRQALVDADDTSQDHVDETVKQEHEPVAEIQAEDMGKPFNAIRVTVHFYAEVPAVGTKLYTAPPKREWVGLTADEIWKCNRAKSGSAVEFHICYAHQNVLDFAEAIEAKLKEKNT